MNLDADIERLVDIGDEVLSGIPIENFKLGEYEIHFVVGYCNRAVDNYMGTLDERRKRFTRGL